MASEEDSWFLSAKQGRSDDLQELVNMKVVEVNKTDSSGNTALHYACGGNHLACVKILISAKAFVNAKNKVGDTPLHKAAWRGNDEIVSALLTAGASMNNQNNEHQKPIDVAKDATISALLTPSGKKLWEDDVYHSSDDEKKEKSDSDGEWADEEDA